MRQTFLLLVLVVVMAGSSVKAQEPPRDKPATQPVAMTTAALTQEQVVAEIMQCGGTVLQNSDTPDGPVVGVSFDRQGSVGSVSNRLSVSPVTDALLGHLRGLNQLRFLSLDTTRVTDAGLAHLQGLSQLESLDLTRTKVTDAGLEHLKGLKQLQTLGLANTKVTDAGLEQLKGLNQLKTLNLMNTKVTDQGVKGLQEILPKCKITR